MTETGYFSTERLEQLEAERDEARLRYERLIIAMTQCTLSNKFAAEVIAQGFGRRVRLLIRCIENIFEYIPPERLDDPTEEERQDCVINLQAFVWNVFGCLDNLALAWVHEKQIKDGAEELKPVEIGLRKKNKAVWKSLPQKVRQYLDTKESREWFTSLDNYRHALAHRVPLYVPPAVVMPSNTVALELNRKWQEARDRFDPDEMERLDDELRKLRLFRPWMKHSYEEKSEEIEFHVRTLFDLKKVEDIGLLMFDALSGRLPLSTP